MGAIFASFSYLEAAEAALLMVVHHPDRLHECIHGSGADEAEAALLKIPGKRGRAVRGKSPEVLRKSAELLLQLKHAARIGDRGVDLARMAHDSRVGEQAASLTRSIRRHPAQFE